MGGACTLKELNQPAAIAGSKQSKGFQEPSSHPHRQLLEHFSLQPQGNPFLQAFVPFPKFTLFKLTCRISFKDEQNLSSELIRRTWLTFSSTPRDDVLAKDSVQYRAVEIKVCWSLIYCNNNRKRLLREN